MFKLLTRGVSHCSQLKPQRLLKPEVHLCADLRGSQASQTNPLLSSEERCTSGHHPNEAEQAATAENKTSQWMHDWP